MVMKQKLYSTAFFPLFNCYVKIVHAYQVGDRWLFYVYNKQEGIGKPEIAGGDNFIASEAELTEFCI